MNDTIITNGAATVPIISMVVPNTKGIIFNIKIIGKDLTNKNIINFEKTISVKCFDNTATIVGGTIIFTHKDSGYTSVGIMESVNGQSVLFSVTGAVGKIIDWMACVNVHIH